MIVLYQTSFDAYVRHAQELPIGEYWEGPDSSVRGGGSREQPQLRPMLPWNLDPQA